MVILMQTIITKTRRKSKARVTWEVMVFAEPPQDEVSVMSPACLLSPKWEVCTFTLLKLTA